MQWCSRSRRRSTSFWMIWQRRHLGTFRIWSRRRNYSHRFGNDWKVGFHQSSQMWRPFLGFGSNMNETFRVWRGRGYHFLMKIVFKDWDVFGRIGIFAISFISTFGKFVFTTPLRTTSWNIWKTGLEMKLCNDYLLE